MVIYLVGSLRNPEVPKIAIRLRQEGFEVFDDWYSAGPIADDSWQQHQKEKQLSFREALQGHAAQHVFTFDLHHLRRADVVVLCLPAGKSGHIEFGWAVGAGKLGYVLFDKEPERWDVMYAFATDVFFDVESLCKELVLKEHETEDLHLGDLHRPAEVAGAWLCTNLAGSQYHKHLVKRDY